MALLRVIDFETTSMPPDADVIESAYVDLFNDKDGCWSIKDGWDGWDEKLVKSDRPVEIGARATHHISDKEIQSGIPWDDARDILCANSPDAYVAHNADFEKQFFDSPDFQWIDTWKCALALYPDAPSFSNQALRYYLPNCDLGDLAMPPHRALPDCWTTAAIVEEMLCHESAATLIEISKLPPAWPTMPFGRHYGEKWEALPSDYLRWITRCKDLKEGVMECAKRELQRRANKLPD